MSNTSQLDSILSRLGEHNVSDKEIDELVATADSSAKDSKDPAKDSEDATVQDKLNEVRARASAKKGNKEIIYDEKPEKSHLKGFCGEKGASFAYSDGKKGAYVADFNFNPDVANAEPQGSLYHLNPIEYQLYKLRARLGFKTTPKKEPDLQTKGVNTDNTIMQKALHEWKAERDKQLKSFNLRRNRDNQNLDR